MIHIRHSSNFSNESDRSIFRVAEITRDVLRDNVSTRLSLCVDSLFMVANRYAVNCEDLTYEIGKLNHTIAAMKAVTAGDKEIIDNLKKDIDGLLKEIESLRKRNNIQANLIYKWENI